ncbi:GDP-D-glucose phosphorylase 1-like isoform X1 [Watersipora subatra]|uniref:GDP-D-glucose phosphorylase 1-like isoform X1 n=1 Tax=Watersipora subatra TaxID=2589382 RepID=UPI00355C2925
MRARLGAMAYIYTENLLKISASRLGRSDFDEKFHAKWDAAMKAGVFRYDLSEVQRKPLEGPHGYQLLLNPKRATDKRPGQSMQCVDQAFDNSKFHFGKVKPEEILLTVENVNRIASARDEVIINASPADYGHSLLVPEVEKHLNQKLTEHAVSLALEVICLSSSSSFRIAFNSLCAYASVNHQHLHCFYNETALFADTVRGTHAQFGLYDLISDAPHGYGFELHEVKDISRVARLVTLCAKHMTENNIAHCMVICRGTSFVDPSKSIVKVLLWPCAKVLGPKRTDAVFNTAAFEMAGLILLYDKKSYETLTDEFAYERLKGCSLSECDFNQLTQQLVELLRVQQL